MFLLLFLSLVSGEIESPPLHRRLLGGSVANGGKKKGLGSLELGLIIAASLIALILMILIIIYICIKKLNRSSRVVETIMSPSRSGTERLVIFKETDVPLTFETVIHATGNFSSRNCIGSGGFGSTYRAEMCPGTTVAVKRLTVEMCQGVPQFNAEIRSLQRIEHPNLITLIGYGVMLLELVSDKRALDPSFSSEQNGYTIVSWVEMLRREGRMTEAFAAGMWEVRAEKVLPDLLQLGLNCTAETASERPSMRHVVRKLKEIRRAFDR
ncbi:hypothetical protein L1987_16330 [Smallanthus sonchifolius]|uniref:Uncharacterized protein n=1 Tax=Smallanthus sonchifolius TaxID=185202 RepID=A0ACB9JBI7_9ASTR|nr:hypothetical protein L1987_16330 [Smallanthus sonchifolius]